MPDHDKDPIKRKTGATTMSARMASTRRVADKQPKDREFAAADRYETGPREKIGFTGIFNPWCSVSREEQQ